MSTFRIAREAVIGAVLAGTLAIAAPAVGHAFTTSAEPDGIRDHDAGRLLAEPVDAGDLRAALTKNGEAGRFAVVETPDGTYRVVPVAPDATGSSQAAR